MEFAVHKEMGADCRIFAQIRHTILAATGEFKQHIMYTVYTNRPLNPAHNSKIDTIYLPLRKMIHVLIFLTPLLPNSIFVYPIFINNFKSNNIFHYGVACCVKNLSKRNSAPRSAEIRSFLGLLERRIAYCIHGGCQR